MKLFYYLIDMTSSIDKKSSDSLCVICLDDTKDTALECGHTFCFKCIYAWHLCKTECPLCRGQIPLEYFHEPPEVVLESHHAYFSQLGIASVTTTTTTAANADTTTVVVPTATHTSVSALRSLPQTTLFKVTIACMHTTSCLFVIIVSITVLLYSQII